MPCNKLIGEVEADGELQLIAIVRGHANVKKIFPAPHVTIKCFGCRCWNVFEPVKKRSPVSD